jgi:hypothetical protein
MAIGHLWLPAHRWLPEAEREPYPIIWNRSGLSPRRYRDMPAPPAEGKQFSIASVGLLAWDSSSDSPSRFRSGIVGPRHPSQLRGSAGFQPASRIPSGQQSKAAADLCQAGTNLFLKSIGISNCSLIEPTAQPVDHRWCEVSLTPDHGSVKFGLLLVGEGSR